MTEYTDAQIAKQLKDLELIIIKGIKRAQAEIDAAQPIKNEVEQHRRSVEKKAEQVEQSQLYITKIAEEVVANLTKVSDLKDLINENLSTAEQLRDEVRATIVEIGGDDVLKNLRQEFYDTRIRLIDAQTKLQQAEDKLHTSEMQIRQRLIDMDRLVSQVERERIETQKKAVEVLQIKSELEDFEHQFHEKSDIFETESTQRLLQIEKLSSQVDSDKIIIFGLKQEIEDKKNIVTNVQANLEKLYQNIVADLQHLKKGLKTINGLVFQVKKDQINVSELAQETANHKDLVLQQKLMVEQIAMSVISTITQIGGSQGLQQLRQEYQAICNQLNATNTNSQQIQQDVTKKIQLLKEESIRTENTLILTQQRLQEMNNVIVAASTHLATNAMAQVLDSVRTQESLLLTQLRPLVAETLTEFGGKVGLENLHQKLEEGNDVLAQMQHHHQELIAGIVTASRTLQELLAVNLSVQETASRNESLRSEVLQISEQINADKEIINKLKLDMETLCNVSNISSSKGLESLQNQLHDTQEKLQRQLITMEARQSFFRKWLFLVTFAVTLALILAIALK